MSTVKIKGQEVEVGDDLWSSGVPHRITRIEPYTHPVVTRGEEWRIAYSDGPADVYKTAWGMTLSFDHGWAASYEVSERPGDTRGEPHLAADDYPSAHYGKGARLHPQYAAAGSPLPWRDWIGQQGSLHHG